jgi:hypothetical protein
MAALGLVAAVAAFWGWLRIPPGMPSPSVALQEIREVSPGETATSGQPPLPEVDAEEEDPLRGLGPLLRERSAVFRAGVRDRVLFERLAARQSGRGLAGLEVAREDSAPEACRLLDPEAAHVCRRAGEILRRVAADPERRLGWDAWPPPPVRALLLETADDCLDSPYGHGRLQVGRNAFRWVDVDLDGRLDVVVSWQHVACERAVLFCGSGGCGLDIFLARPEGGYRQVFGETVSDWTLHLGRPAILDVGLHGASCDRAGFERCRVVWRWQGDAFVVDHAMPGYGGPRRWSASGR